MLPRRLLAPLLLAGATLSPLQAQQTPRIDSIRPRTAVAGEVATVYGQRLSRPGAESQVRVGTARAVLLSAAADRITFRVPTRGLRCEPGAPYQDVTVTAGGAPARIRHPVGAAQPVRLAPGEAATPRDLREGLCIQFGPGRYYVLAANTTTDSAAPAEYALWGAAIPPGPPVPAPPGPMPLAARGAQAGQRVARLEATRIRRDTLPRGASDAHLQQLAESRVAFRHAALAARSRDKALRGFQWRPVPRVGDVVAFRFDTTRASPYCSHYRTVRGRAAYVGTRAIIFTDVAAAPALSPADDSAMDAAITAMGAEFDTVMYDLVRDHFGDPLIHDARLDGDRRVRILFTSAVNVQHDSMEGLVNPCDLYPLGAKNKTSNEGEVIYISWPSAHRPYRMWIGGIRSTLVHELKHVAGDAARVHSGQAGGEADWVEEGMAKHAEEVYARRFTGARQGRNTDFATGVRCDFRSTSPCPSQPAELMSRHFAMLYGFWGERGRSASLIPDRVESWTYGGSWSLIRHMVDRSGLPEEKVYRDITSARDSGAETLTRHTGVDFRAGLVDWLLASAVDDLPGFTPARPEHAHPSWNTRSVFGGLHAADAQRFPWDFPVLPWPIHFDPTLGSYDSALPRASGDLYDLQGSGFLVGIQRRDGSPMPPDTPFALAVIRIQ